MGRALFPEARDLSGVGYLIRGFWKIPISTLSQGHLPLITCDNRNADVQNYERLQALPATPGKTAR